MENQVPSRSHELNNDKLAFLERGQRSLLEHVRGVGVSQPH